MGTGEGRRGEERREERRGEEGEKSLAISRGGEEGWRDFSLLLPSSFSTPPLLLPTPPPPPPVFSSSPPPSLFFMYCLWCLFGDFVGTGEERRKVRRGVRSALRPRLLLLTSSVPAGPSPPPSACPLLGEEVAGKRRKVEEGKTEKYEICFGTFWRPGKCYAFVIFRRMSSFLMLYIDLEQLQNDNFNQFKF